MYTYIIITIIRSIQLEQQMIDQIMQNQPQIQQQQIKLSSTINNNFKRFNLNDIQILFFQEKPISLTNSSISLPINKDCTSITIQSTICNKSQLNQKAQTTKTQKALGVLCLVVSYEDILCICKNKGVIMIMIKGEQSEWNEDSDESSQQLDKVNPIYTKIVNAIKSIQSKNYMEVENHQHIKQQKQKLSDDKNLQKVTLKLSSKCNITLFPSQKSYQKMQEHQKRTQFDQIYKQLQSQLDNFQKQIQVEKGQGSANNQILLNQMGAQINQEAFNMMSLDLGIDNYNYGEQEFGEDQEDLNNYMEEQQQEGSTQK